MNYTHGTYILYTYVPSGLGMPFCDGPPSRSRRGQSARMAAITYMRPLGGPPECLFLSSGGSAFQFSASFRAESRSETNSSATRRSIWTKSQLQKSLWAKSGVTSGMRLGKAHKKLKRHGNGARLRPQTASGPGQPPISTGKTAAPRPWLPLGAPPEVAPLLSSRGDGRWPGPEAVLWQSLMASPSRFTETRANRRTIGAYETMHKQTFTGWQHQQAHVLLLETSKRGSRVYLEDYLFFKGQKTPELQRGARNSM